VGCFQRGWSSSGPFLEGNRFQSVGDKLRTGFGDTPTARLAFISVAQICGAPPATGRTAARATYASTASTRAERVSHINAVDCVT
jgi:hypothetical protein